MRRTSRVDPFHRNGSRRWTDKRAEIASDALFLKHIRIPLAVDVVESEALVCAVFAGDITEIAADAILVIDLSFHIIIEIKVSPIGDTFNRLSDNVVDWRESLIVQIIIQPVDHVLDDPITVMHNGRTHLNATGAEK